MNLFETDPWYQRFLKYTVLLSIKESYLLVRNGFGLAFHPFKTLRSLIREQDFSQILLVIGFPLYWILVGLGIIWLGRKIVKAPPGEWGIFTHFGILVVLLISIITFGYIGYWLWQIWKKTRNPIRVHKH